MGHLTARWWNSLHVRLLIGTLLGIVASVLIAGWVLSEVFTQTMSEQLAREVRVHLNELAAGLNIDASGVATFENEPADPRMQRPFSGLYWQIDQIHADGSVETGVFQSRSLWDEVLNFSQAQPQKGQQGLWLLSGPKAQTLVVQTQVVTPAQGEGTWRLIVATDHESLRKPQQRFERLLIISLGLIGLVTVIAVWVQLSIALKPLRRLRQSLQAVQTGTARRIEGMFPAEIQPLTDDFNAVLETGEQIIQSARTQAGNLAHALKTPLTVMTNASRNDQSELGRLVFEQTDIARRQIDHHLARARAIAAARMPGVATKVMPEINKLVQTLDRLYASKALQWHVDVQILNLLFQGDRQDFLEMMGNVLDNACQWTDRDVWIEVTQVGSETMSQLQIVVQDNGPGLTAAQCEMMFERGVRLDERAPGSGLGLAIVRDLAHAYAGQADAQRSEYGGLKVVLILPGIVALK